RFTYVVGHYRRRQALLYIVLQLYSSVYISLVADQVKYRGECFFLYNLHFVAYLRYDWCNIAAALEAIAIQYFSFSQELSPLCFNLFNSLEVVGHRAFIDQWTHVIISV